MTSGDGQSPELDKSDFIDKTNEPDELREELKDRYMKYLKTSFYFRDSELQESFTEALKAEQVPDQLIKGPINKYARSFMTGEDMKTMLERQFGEKHTDALPAFMTDHPLYLHQETAIRKAYGKENVVISTGTASGKTECFLYPVLMELYRQHLAGELNTPGVRAMVLYPMNALANDQSDRLRKLCKSLDDAGSEFRPTFGKYTGETPDKFDGRFRRPPETLDNELLTREEIRENPPHILLTNYSMLEYLLIRPWDCDLFDGDRGSTWKFIILDEAHVYRGTKGMEIGMLLRRLRHRLKQGGNQQINCIAASATLVAGRDADARSSVANFASELFGEKFEDDGVIFETRDPETEYKLVHKHYFLRGLSGAYLSFVDGKNKVQLNNDAPLETEPIEIALCKECGQHYYVGRIDNGYLVEPIRDRSNSKFGVRYFLPIDSEETEDSAAEQDNLYLLNRITGKISQKHDMEATNEEDAMVVECKNHTERMDWIELCPVCTSFTKHDPVQELVHNREDPNAIIATTLLQQSGDNEGGILAFSDSRLFAAYFPVHMEKFYRRLAARGLLNRTIAETEEELGIKDLTRRLLVRMDSEKCFDNQELTDDDRKLRAARIVLSEALAQDTKNSLEGVCLLKWSIEVPQNFIIPTIFYNKPWNLDRSETKMLVSFLLDDMRKQKAVEINHPLLGWRELDDENQSQRNFRLDSKRHSKDTKTKLWIYKGQTTRERFLYAFLAKKNPGLSSLQIKTHVKDLLIEMWQAMTQPQLLNPLTGLLHFDNEAQGYRLNVEKLRCERVQRAVSQLYKCKRCAHVRPRISGDICPRYKCNGALLAVNDNELAELEQNYYSTMYEEKLSWVKAEEHTAQLERMRANKKQKQFENNEIDILSSSTTFEMGVDIGELTHVLMCNVPPEPYNYIQRAGRAGRRESAGTIVTYCGSTNHDKFHFINPVKTIMKPPDKLIPLKVDNTQIIERHAVAEIFSSFFRKHTKRFGTLKETFSNQLGKASLSKLLQEHTANHEGLKQELMSIVPKKAWVELDFMHEQEAKWIERLVGKDSRLAQIEQMLCYEYQFLSDLCAKAKARQHYKDIYSYQARLKFIRNENVISFLSKKAIIPKYGFPVDVVELDLSICDHMAVRNVQFSRDRSQAISEFAPGSGLVADKRDYRSYGLKTYSEKDLVKKYYYYDKEHLFEAAWTNESGIYDKKYIVPEMGFVIERGYEPPLTRHRPSRQYSTRSYLVRYKKENLSDDDMVQYGDLIVVKPLPAEMATLCEGRDKKGFKVCLTCGCARPGDDQNLSHETPFGEDCNGRMGTYSLGHEFVTSVVQLRRSSDAWKYPDMGVYALGYALMYGLADALKIPENDLNMTITAGNKKGRQGILLYDNVPGGAGLVENLMDPEIFKNVIELAKERVSGACNCKLTKSCYSCLRSWRNQPFHDDLRRIDALKLLNDLPKITTDTMLPTTNRQQVE